MVDITAFVTEMRSVNDELRENGAWEQAEARERLLCELEDFMAEFNQGGLNVRAAAFAAGVHEETVRRAIRGGEIVLDAAGQVPRTAIPALMRKRRRKRLGKKARTDYTSSLTRLQKAAIAAGG